MKEYINVPLEIYLILKKSNRKKRMLRILISDPHVAFYFELILFRTSRNTCF